MHIFPSALINAMSGRLGDFVYGKKGGTDYVRTVSTSTYDPQTARVLQIRANFAAVSAAFDNLSGAYKQLWQTFAVMKRGPGDGRSQHQALNCNLLNASHAELTVITHPPLRPGTPEHPMHFCVTQISFTVNCITWATPADTDTFLTGHYRLHYGFCKRHPSYGCCCGVGIRRKWRFVATERADTQAIRHEHDFPTNTRLFYRLNSIDKWGRKSPFTHVLGRITRA